MLARLRGRAIAVDGGACRHRVQYLGIAQGCATLSPMFAMIAEGYGCHTAHHATRRALLPGG